MTAAQIHQPGLPSAQIHQPWYLNTCIAVDQLVPCIPAAKVPGAFNGVVGGASRRVEVDVHLLLRGVRSVLLDLNHRDDADVSHRRVGHVQR